MLKLLYINLSLLQPGNSFLVKTLWILMSFSVLKICNWFLFVVRSEFVFRSWFEWRSTTFRIVQLSSNRGWLLWMAVSVSIFVKTRMMDFKMDLKASTSPNRNGKLSIFIWPVMATRRLSFCVYSKTGSISWFTLCHLNMFPWKEGFNDVNLMCFTCLLKILDQTDERIFFVIVSIRPG